MLAMPSAFLVKESSAEIFARAAIMLLHSITRPVREPASRSDDTKRRQDMTLDWSTYRTAPTGKFSTGASPCFGCRRPWAGPAVAAASLALAPLVPGQHFCAEVPIDDPKVVALCRSTIAPRPSSPTTWNEFLPISMPITAIALCAVAAMACSLSWRPWPAYRWRGRSTAGPSH